MLQQPEREALDAEPFWTTYYIFEESGADSVENRGEDSGAGAGEGAFAYTQGLATRGFPELLIHAVPAGQPRGLPPSQLWQFGRRDCAYLIDEFARMLVAGSLVPGTPLRRHYDGGLTSIEWLPLEPVPAGQTQALLAASDAKVIVVRATMDAAPQPAQAQPGARAEPRGTASRPGAAALKRCRALLARLLRAADDATFRPVNTALTPRPRRNASFTGSGRFGPMTPLVEAAALGISRADAYTLASLGGIVLNTEQTVGPQAALATSVAAANAAGRTRASEEAREYAYELVGSMVGPAWATKRWRDVLELVGLDGDADESGDDDNPVDIESGVAALILDATTAFFAALVVYDQLPELSWLQSSGAWTAAQSPTDMPLFDEFLAPAHVHSTVRALLAPLTADELFELARAWKGKRATGRDDGIIGMLLGLACTGRRAPLPLLEYLEPSTAVNLVQSPMLSNLYAHLGDLLATLTALLSEREHFDACDIESWCAGVESLLPGIREALDGPM